jgi:hypothetical protein
MGIPGGCSPPEKRPTKASTPGVGGGGGGGGDGSPPSRLLVAGRDSARGTKLNRDAGHEAAAQSDVVRPRELTRAGPFFTYFFNLFIFVLSFLFSFSPLFLEKKNWAQDSFTRHVRLPTHMTTRGRLGDSIFILIVHRTLLMAS